MYAIEHMSHLIHLLACPTPPPLGSGLSCILATGDVIDIIAVHVYACIVQR